jgi:hypothetical protein
MRRVTLTNPVAVAREFSTETVTVYQDAPLG